MLVWSTNQIADILDVSPSTVRGWISRKHLHAVKLSNQEGNAVRDASLFDFLHEHPKYLQIFMHKLFAYSTFYGLSSEEVCLYLHRKGYLP